MTRIIAIAAIVVAGTCTTAMNWRFSFQLGTTLWDSYTWAIFSVALDVAKWIMLPYGVLAWKGHKLRAMAAMSIWFMATTYSFAAAIGFAALNRDTSIAERHHQTDLRRTLETMKRSPRWQSTAACADVTAPRSKEFCDRYKELAAQLKSASQEADPQTALFARLTGLKPETVAILLSVFLAVACEMISALGFYAILSPTKERVSETPLPTWKAPRWKPQATSTHVNAGHGAAGFSATQPVMPWRSTTKKNPR